MENFISETLEASMSNPDDDVEVTLLTDAASVGITTPLFGSNKRVKLTEDFLRANAGSFKGMPITLEIKEEEEDEKGNHKLVPHSKTVIGVIKDAYFDEAKGKVATVGSLWKHYFPKTLKQLNEIYRAGKAQVSWELLPEELKALPEEGEDVFEAIKGRFVGQSVVNNGADLGNAITLLAAAASEEAGKIKHDPEPAPVGSFEWIGEQVANYLSASSNADNYTPKTIIGTFPDQVIYSDSGKFYKLPIEIQGTNIKFSDTIEVEPIYQPLGASAAGSNDNVPEVPLSNNKEAGKSNMAEIDEKELETLKASKTQAETRVGELEADLQAKDTEIETLKAAVADAEAFKAQVEADKAEQAANTLAASRIEEVEKIIPYDDEKQKAEDLETFKTMDEKAFEVIKRTLQAAAETKGGVSFTDGILNPFTSREDEDGAAAKILNDPVYQAIKQSYAAPTKEAN